MRAEVVRRTGASAFVLAVFAFFWVPAAATEVWVGPCSGTGAGTQANPYCKIQTAICNIKTVGGTVHVFPGTYREAIRIPTAVQVISTDGPAVTTILATGKPCPNQDFCGIGNQPNCSAVYIPPATGSANRIEGFHITNVNGGLDQPVGAGSKIGAGIVVFGANPTITRNEIVGNTISSPTYNAFYGAGIYVQASGFASIARPVITANLIQGNIADPPAGTSSLYPSEGDGAGIYAGSFSAPVISGNTIKGNRAGNYATSFQVNFGGGIAVYSITASLPLASITRNLITGNVASDFGGGVSLESWTPAGVTYPTRAVVEDNVFEMNTSDDGGAVATTETLAVINNNTMYKNTTTSHGGAIYVGTVNNPSYVPSITNNLITSNLGTGTALGGGIWVGALPNTVPIVRYNDIWANTPNNVDGSRSDGSYIGVNGNISVDPLYVDRNAVPGNYRLLSNSPVIDKGDNSAVINTTDFDGAPRIQNGDYNGAATVDMGAFEYSPDYDGDGTPDWQDADEDNDGVANALDCAPLNRAVSRVPDKLGNSVRVDKPSGVATMTWLHAFQAPTYNVYRGTFGGGVPFAYNEVCFNIENAARSLAVTESPVTPGSGFYYIIGSRNSCGESAAVTNGAGQDHTPAQRCATQDRNSDADTLRDIGDNCPLLPNATQGDADNDSQGDACDNCPSLANIDQADPDGDGRGSSCDNCPNASNAGQADSDGDGIGDACDNCPNAPNAAQTNADGDTLGDACDSCPGDPLNDADNDGICAGVGFTAPKTADHDNCPTASNTNQANADGDAFGDACDVCANDPLNDADNDGICAGTGFLAPKTGDHDNCSTVANPDQLNSDADTLGDACDSCPFDTMNDVDHDGLCGNVDNCPTVSNANQANGDGDTRGDLCDNCPTVSNSNQQDTVGNGVGDACRCLGVTCPATDVCHVQGTCAPTTGACLAPTNAPNGTSCNDGNACTQTDACQGGACVGANPVTCTASDQCHLPGTCSAATGVCSSSPIAPDGTQCSDGNACTIGDACGSGVCAGGSPVDCAPSDLCHTSGTCDPQTGACSNPPVVCTASEPCHLAGSCDPGTGSCSNPVIGDGAPCDDGSQCIAGGTCAGGVCGGGSAGTPPAETANLTVGDDKTTYTWSAASTATHYDVVRGTTARFPVGPGGGTETCFGNLSGTALEDPAIPSAGGGFWYLSRGTNACGSGTFGHQSNGSPRSTTTCP